MRSRVEAVLGPLEFGQRTSPQIVWQIAAMIQLLATVILAIPRFRHGSWCIVILSVFAGYWICDLITVLFSAITYGGVSYPRP